MGSFELPSITSAITKVWKRDNSNLFQDLPQCPNVVPPTPTSSDSKLLAYRKQQSADQAAAASNYKKVKDAQAAENAKANLNLANQLPDDAPAWAQKYVTVYGNSTNGNVVVNEKDNNVSIYVFRAWSVVQNGDSLAKVAARTKVDTALTSYYGKVPDDTIYYSYEAGAINTSGTTYTLQQAWVFYARTEKTR